MDTSPFQGNLGGEYPYTIRMTQKEKDARRAKRKKYMQDYYKAHPEKWGIKGAIQMDLPLCHPYLPRHGNGLCKSCYSRQWKADNRERARKTNRESMKRAYDANPEKYTTRSTTWRNNNLELDGERQKKYRRKRRPLMRAYFQNRLDTDVNFRIAHRLRSQLRKALNRNQKSGGAIELLGCSIPEFRFYLESLWEEGMVWSNYGNKKGQWNTDHLIPCALFDLTKPEHQKRCFHFSNLRPMWAIPNMSKGKKLVTNQFQLL